MTQSFKSLLAMASLVALASCTSAPPTGTHAEKNEAETVLAAPVLAAPAASPVETPALSGDQRADIYARLARLESDVSGVKVQVSQIGPILEKMPALQDKLSELVTELQRIDARVVAAQTQSQKPVQAAPVSAATPVVKPVDVTPPTARVPEPSLKPAPVKGLMSEPTTTTAPPTPAGKPEKAAIKPVDSRAGDTRSSVKVDTDKKAAPTLSAASKQLPAELKQVRVGDYSDKTRLVLDTSRKVPFVYDLDNNEKILIVDLDTPQFSAPAGMDFAKSPLIASYTAQAVAGGKSRLVFQLRAAVDVAKTQALPPNGEKGDRVVIDLVKAKN